MSSFKVRDMYNEVSVKFSTFPGGEEYVNVITPNLGYSTTLYAAITDSKGVLQLIMLVDALRRNGVREIYLEMPYVPYGRQDRMCNRGESFSLKVFCDLINTMKLDRVVITDPHSDVTPALLNNCIVRKVEDIVDLNAIYKMGKSKDLILVSPDAGANKKVFNVSKTLGGLPVVRADKVRDVKTTEILDTVVYSEHVGSKNFLIIDDIFDGGRTFVELGKKLKQLTIGKVSLYVTHLIAGKGTKVLDGVVDELYYYNCFDESKLDSTVVKHVVV